MRHGERLYGPPGPCGAERWARSSRTNKSTFRGTFQEETTVLAVPNQQAAMRRLPSPLPSVEQGIARVDPLIGEGTSRRPAARACQNPYRTGPFEDTVQPLHRAQRF
eukprot:UN2762